MTRNTDLEFAALFGLFVFGEFPDLWVWVGAAIIIAATSYIAHRERAAQDAASPAA